MFLTYYPRSDLIMSKQFYSCLFFFGINENPCRQRYIHIQSKETIQGMTEKKDIREFNLTEDKVISIMIQVVVSKEYEML